MRTFPHSRRVSRGFTLFELLIALAVVTLVVGMVVAVGGDFLDRDLKRTSNQLSSTMRYLYNKSILDGIYIRLVFDLDERSYWVEATGDPYLIVSPDEFDMRELERRERIRERVKEEDDAKKSFLTETSEDVPKLLPREPQFSQVAEHLLRPVKLPDGVYFKDIAVEHDPRAVNAGKVTIAFFPNGYVEAAIINLRDEDDEVHYSLKTNPVLGEVNIESEYRTFEE